MVFVAFCGPDAAGMENSPLDPPYSQFVKTTSPSPLNINASSAMVAFTHPFVSAVGKSD